MDQERVKEILRARGMKVTAQRMLVVEVIADRPGEHLTAEEIYALVREKYPEIGLATIYRTVQLLVDLQIIDKVSFNDGFARYELGKLTQEKRHHHHHAICRSCGAVIPFEDDLLDMLEQAVFDATGFRVTDHEVKLYGYCEKCSRKEKNRTEESN